MTEPDVESKYSTFNLYAVSIYIGSIATAVKRIYQRVRFFFIYLIKIS